MLDDPISKHDAAMPLAEERIGVSACGRVGGCKASSIPSRPPGHYSRVEKQSYFPRRPYANTPTRPYVPLAVVQSLCYNVSVTYADLRVSMRKVQSEI